MSSFGLSPLQLFQLDLACRPIWKAFKSTPYLVGSALTERNPRDIDVRLVLDDDQYDQLIPTPKIRTILSMAFSAYLAQATGLPIDFGIQRRTQANAQHPHGRNPLGGRELTDWRGDVDL